MAATDSTSGRWNIWQTDADGTDPVKISTRNSLYADPNYSPDGTKIVCTAFPSDYTGSDLSYQEVFLMDSDGTDEVRLTTDDPARRDNDPIFSPDGSEIIWERQDGGLLAFDWDIYGIEPDGDNKRCILDDNAVNAVPRYDANSENIYFHRCILFSEDWHICRIKNDSTNRIQITSPSDGSAEENCEYNIME